MHENKEKLIRTGVAVLNASRNELYVAMRFLDLALNSLGYELDLSMRSIGTDSQSIRFNPTWLVQNYRDDSILVNRAYLHMILHCVFRHMFHGEDKDPELWNLSCDIAVTSVIDSMDYRCVRLTVPDQRQAMYDRLRQSLKVLTAEGIYKTLKAHPLTYFEMEELKRFFTVDDHVFWDSKSDDKDGGDQKGNQSQEQDDQKDHDQNQDSSEDQKDRERQQQDQKWQEISEKMRTNMETYSKDATDLAGDLYDYIRIETRQRYDYPSFLKKFTALREEVRLDLDSFDYIYYTYGFSHYGNMPLVEPLEYKESRKIEELAIVIDTSESCEGEYVRRFLEETFAILMSRDQFFRRMNVHIIQCDVKAQVDDVIRSSDDLKKYMENFKLVGFGGTDFRPAIEYVNRLCAEGAFKKLKGLLYFTDGWGTYPRRRPDYDVAFVFLEENYNDREVPPWAIKLVLGPDDFETDYGRK